jgi:flagellar motor switch protein FliN/FliY
MTIELENVLASAIDRWKDAFGGVLDTMAGFRPEMPPSNPPDEDEIGAMLWWRQDFKGLPGLTMWLGAPSHTWTRTGQLLLASAGVEAAPESDVRDSFLEVLKQTYLVFARSLSAELGQEILSGAGQEQAPPAGLTASWVGLRPPQETLTPISIQLSEELLLALLSRARQVSQELREESGAEPSVEDDDAEPQLPPRARSTLDVLLDVEMPVHVSFGKTRYRIQDVLKLGSGSVIELDRAIADPVEVVVNNCVIARGAVVVVNGNYAVQIKEVVSHQERLQQSRRFMLPEAVAAR